jgi:hypothetical protein
MAGIMDPNDIQGVAEAMEELRKNGTLSAEALAKLGGNSVSAGKALEGYTKGLLGAAGAVGGMARAVADGEGQFKSLGGAVGGLAAAFNTVASNFGTFGKMLGAVSVAGAEVAKYVLDQLDVLQTNYRTLGDVSAGAADGVDGLLRQFDALGNFSLPAFTKAVRANVTGLAAFRGTAAQGAEELSKVAGVLTTGDMANRFIKLGMSLDAVGDITTEYLATSARYGILQGATTEELTKKTQNYIEEVDKIARLTGQTREAQAKEAQKSLVQVQFRAKLADMVAKGQAEQAQELRMLAEGLGGAAGDTVRMLALGIPLSKDAAKANLFSNDALRQNTLAVQQGKKAVDAIADSQQALADGSTRFGTQLMYVGDVFGGVALQGLDNAEIIKEQNKSLDGNMTRQQAIDAIQKRQATAEGKVTGKFVDATLAVADTSKNLQSLGFVLAEAAIPAVAKFADILKSATDKARNYFGIRETPTSRPAGGAGGATVGSTGGSRSVTIGDQTRIGGDRNWRNNNPGNIEYGPFAMQYGAVGSDGRFAIFPSEELGRKAQDALLKSKNYANLSLRDAINRYAPSNENNPRAYVNQIATATGVDITKTYASLTPEQQGKVLDEMKRIEGGRAGTIAGPTSGYRSQVAGGNPSSAGSETTAQGNQAASQQQTASVDNRMIQRLDELVALQRQNNSINAKLLQNSRG